MTMRSDTTRRTLVAAVIGWLGVVGLAAPNPNGEPVLERCLVSLKDEARVPAQEAGVIVEVAVREGDKVKAGQVIAKLKADQPEMEKRKATAEHEQAVAKAESDIDIRFGQEARELAELDVRKSENARASSAQSVTEIVLEEKKLAVVKANLQIEQAKLQQRLDKMAAQSKQVEVDAADNAIERRLIRSPLAGVVEDLAKHQGEWLQPGDTLAHVLRTDTLRVEGFIDASKWNPGEVRDRPVTVEVTLANGKRERFPGKISFVSEKVESGGDYRVYADVANRPAEADGEEWLLRAGQTARMTIHTLQPPAGR